MEQYDFIKEELESLIRTIKKQDYRLGKYLADHLVLDGKTGNITYTGDDAFLKSVSTKLVIQGTKTSNS